MVEWDQSSQSGFGLDTRRRRWLGGYPSPDPPTHSTRSMPSTPASLTVVVLERARHILQQQPRSRQLRQGKGRLAGAGGTGLACGPVGKKQSINGERIPASGRQRACRGHCNSGQQGVGLALGATARRCSALAGQRCGARILHSAALPVPHTAPLAALGPLTDGPCR